MIAESAIQTAINSLLALDTLKVAGVIPEDTFDAILYGAAQMPTESEIAVARDALKSMVSLQVNGNFPQIVELALYSLIAEGSGNSYIASTEKGVAGGVATLDAVTGRLPLAQLSTEVVGAVVYQGTWNASTNTPTLVSGGGSGAQKGHYYAVSTGGTQLLDGVGGADDPWGAGDAVIFNGTAWQRIDARDAVRSVNGQTGIVSLTAANVGAEPAFISQVANRVLSSPDGSAGVPTFRALAAADIPSATNLLRGAISREASSTFTPTLEGTTTAGLNTYGSQTGTYYLVGKICVATIFISLTAKDAAMAGNAQIGGLPFNSSSALQAASITQYSQVTFAAGNTQLTARIESSSSKILLFQSGSGIGATLVPVANIGGTFLIIISAVYITA